MRKEDLERFLEKHYSLGFNKDTDDIDHLGWIMLMKRKPHDRYLAYLAEGEEPEFVKEQETIRKSPYLVRIFEMERRIYELQKHTNSDDESNYKINEYYRFASLEDVDAFLEGYGKTLADIKWPIEIGCP